MKYKWILKLLGIIVLFFIIVLGYYTYIDYSPEEIEKVNITQKNERAVKDEITLLSWNIGYAGMGEKMDYFLDGGNRNNPTKDEAEQNFTKIKNYLNQKEADIYLLQEVDTGSKRSYFTDQYKEIQNIFKNYNSAYALNFVNPYIPLPLRDPVGQVHAGVTIFSKFDPTSAKRIQLPGQYKWPKSLMALDRCMLEMRFPYKDEEVVVINTHNSAFDKGNLKKMQMNYIKEKALKEYKKGNYVIIGGDWNMIFPGVALDAFSSKQKVPEWTIKINEDIMPSDWKWVFDDKQPTARSADIPYKKGINYTTILDGYLISPNIELRKITTENLHFEATDHNPVYLKIRLKS